MMETSEFDDDGKRKKDYLKVRFSKGVVTDIYTISQRRTDLEDKDCFYYRSYFEWFRDNLDRKEKIRRQNLPLLAWASVIPGAQFFEVGQRGR